MSLFWGTLTFVVFVSSSGIVGIENLYRKKIEVQLQLDACVLEASSDLVETLQKLESANKKIKALRAAAGVAVLTPQAKAAIQAALQGLVIFQDALRVRWKTKQVFWLTDPKCNGKFGDFLWSHLSWANRRSDRLFDGWVRGELASLNAVRVPADFLGPNVLQMDDPPQGYFIEAVRLPQKSQIRVQAQKIIGIGREWSRQWSNQ